MDRQLLKILYKTYYHEIVQYLFFLSRRTFIIIITGKSRKPPYLTKM